MNDPELLCKGDIVVKINWLIPIQDYTVLDALKHVLDDDEITKEVLNLAIEYVKNTFEDDSYITDLIQDTVNGILENNINDILDTIEFTKAGEKEIIE